MKAVVWHGGSELRHEMVEEPVAREGQVVIDVSLTGVCGSDLHPLRGNSGPRVAPLILGHELVGTVAGRPGRFAVFPLATCGHCPACERGEENLCEQRGLLGLDRPGSFAERVAVPDGALIPLPGGLDDRLGVLVEPLATPLSAIRLAALSEGSRVVVIGCGPIGLLTVHLAAGAGHEVVAVDPVAHRRDLATGFGASRVSESAGTFDGFEADLVVDAVGVAATVAAGTLAVRRGGSVVIVGLGAADGVLPIADLVRRGVSLRGHYAYTREDFAEAARHLAERPPDLGWLTVVDLASTPNAVRDLIEHPEATTKVVLRVGGDAG